MSWNGGKWTQYYKKTFEAEAILEAFMMVSMKLRLCSSYLTNFWQVAVDISPNFGQAIYLLSWENISASFL